MLRTYNARLIVRDVVPENLAVRLVVVPPYSYEVIIRSAPGYLSTRSWIITRAALYSIMRSPRARCVVVWCMAGHRPTCWFSGPHFAHRLFYVSCIIDPLPVSRPLQAQKYLIPPFAMFPNAVKRVHYVTTSTRRFSFKRPYSIDTLEWWKVEIPVRHSLCDKKNYLIKNNLLTNPFYFTTIFVQFNKKNDASGVLRNEDTTGELRHCTWIKFIYSKLFK